jgi:hypothetical protein
MLIASKVCEVITSNFDPLVYWRAGFIFGFATSLVGMYIRASKYKSSTISLRKEKNLSAVFSSNRQKIIRIAILCGFSYISYPVCFVIMTAILPLIKDISLAQVIKINSNLIIFDGLIIIASGYFLQFVRLKTFMIICAIILLFCEFLLLWMVPYCSIGQLTLIRMLLIAVGVPFSLSLKIWLANVMDDFGDEKYFINSIGVSLGTELFGRSITVLSLYTFHLYENFIYSMIYISIIFVGAIYSICSYPYKSKPDFIEKRF